MLKLTDNTPVIIGLISEEHSIALREAGITNCKSLLKACATTEGRLRLSEKTGIPETTINELIQCAELMRIPDLKWEYLKLLKKAGVDSICELAKQNPHLLLAHIVEANVNNNLALKIPFEYQVQSWIKKAVRMKPVIRI